MFGSEEDIFEELTIIQTLGHMIRSNFCCCCLYFLDFSEIFGTISRIRFISHKRQSEVITVLNHIVKNYAMKAYGEVGV